jgi:hypothetical protein
MKHLAFILASLLTTVVACITTSEHVGGGQACDSDHCVCVGDDACSRDCTPDAAECHVEGASAAVSVKCDHNGECHVECETAESCSVDCGGSTQCDVTCPDGACTVANCIGDSCAVTCGFTGVATRSGTTAHCP